MKTNIQLLKSKNHVGEDKVLNFHNTAANKEQYAKYLQAHIIKKDSHIEVLTKTNEKINVSLNDVVKQIPDKQHIIEAKHIPWNKILFK